MWARRAIRPNRQQSPPAFLHTRPRAPHPLADGVGARVHVARLLALGVAELHHEAVGALHVHGVVELARHEVGKLARAHGRVVAVQHDGEDLVLRPLGRLADAHLHLQRGAPLRTAQHSNTLHG